MASIKTWLSIPVKFHQNLRWCPCQLPEISVTWRRMAFKSMFHFWLWQYKATDKDANMDDDDEGDNKPDAELSIPEGNVSFTNKLDVDIHDDKRNYQVNCKMTLPTQYVLYIVCSRKKLTQIIEAAVLRVSMQMLIPPWLKKMTMENLVWMKLLLKMLSRLERKLKYPSELFLCIILPFSKQIRQF